MVWYEDVITREDGTELTVPSSGLSINKDIYNSIMNEFGGIYVLETRLKNNENRDFVRFVYLQIAKETDTDYIIEGGLSHSDFFIVESNKKLRNGDEVFVIN